MAIVAYTAEQIGIHESLTNYMQNTKATEISYKGYCESPYRMSATTLSDFTKVYYMMFHKWYAENVQMVYVLIVESKIVAHNLNDYAQLQAYNEDFYNNEGIIEYVAQENLGIK